MGPRPCTYLVHSLERQPERTLPESGLGEVRLPQQVRVAEHHFNRFLVYRGGLLLWGIDVGPADDPARADDVERDLDVKRPVARVVEDKDGGDGCGGEVDGLCRNIRDTVRVSRRGMIRLRTYLR